MSMVQLEVWQLISLLVVFVGAWAGMGWALFGQIDKRLDGRFASMESSRGEATKHWDTKFVNMAEEQKAIAQQWRDLERDFFKFRGDLPLEYVRREDFIRNQSIIEAKLDAVALHIQNLQLKGYQP